MYLKYFGLSAEPFSIAPDPAYLYMSERHREALAHLLYAFQGSGAFVLLSGEVGTGKTTVTRALLEQLPDNADVALIVNPRLNATELLRAVADEFGVQGDTAADASTKDLVDAINKHLIDAHAAGRNCVLIIDEAQNLSIAAMEQLRLLTNLETNTRKLLQIILVGQPELREILARPELRQLAQRITARYHIEPLSAAQIESYVRHRLAAAGVERSLFASECYRALYRYTKGIPRLINTICDRALLGAYAGRRDLVDRLTLDGAATEVLGNYVPVAATRHRNAARNWVWPTVSAVLAAVLLVGVLWAWPKIQPDSLPQASASAVSKPIPQQLDVTPEIAEPVELPPKPIITKAPPVAPPAKLEVIAPQAAETSTDTVSLDQPVVQDLPTTQKQVPWHRFDEQSVALQRLAGVWQSVLPDTSGSDCTTLGNHGLRCLQNYGDIDSLRALNRPAVLELTGPGGEARYAVLTSLTDKYARLETESLKLDVPIRRLQQLWLGKFTLLWQMPPAGTRLLGLGSENSDVQWLRQQLNQYFSDTIEPSGLANRYDERLRLVVARFQREQGLSADGIVGMKTLSRLNAALNDGVPRLDQ